jgi:hypothetical protein
MTNRSFHRRVSTLFALVQAAPATRVIEWPQPMEEKRARSTRTSARINREIVYAHK